MLVHIKRMNAAFSSKEKDVKEREKREMGGEGEGEGAKGWRSRAGNQSTAGRPQNSPPHLHLQVHGI